jgi:hypothetical protein
LRALRFGPVSVALTAVALGVAAMAPGCGGEAASGADKPVASVPDPPAGGNPIDVLRAAPVPLPEIHLTPPPDKIAGPSYPIATVRHGQRVELRDSPGGEVVATLGDRTEFDSKRSFWVARVQGDWLGVPAPELGNGQLGWIRDDRFDLDISETHYWILASISRQQLELHHGNRVLNRFTVTVGSASSPTPLGDYAVTDGLAGRGLGPYYGCCVLALTGHQPNLPPGWLGGDRIAIHGTPGSIGGANSAGCLRASDRNMVQLFARVPLGAPVFIRA